MSIHTCHAECPCQTGGEPLPDFETAQPTGDRGFPLWAWRCETGHRWVDSRGTAQACPKCGTVQVERTGPA